ncbi:MAG TPA: hypothetical protein VJV05_13150 [Pyrinomonadaceae bacterium]|nr:hypothetical protein [Pyrinomonadaceae bacterium]
MQSIQKTILKIVVTIALLSSVGFADGEMAGGGLANNPSNPTTTVVCPADEGQTNNGQPATTCESETNIEWLLNELGELLGLNG